MFKLRFSVVLVVVTVFLLAVNVGESAENFVLDASNLLYGLSPGVVDSLGCEAASSAPFVDLLEKFIMLGSDLSQEIDSEQSLFPLITEMSDRPVDDGRLGRASMRCQSGKQSSENDELSVQSLSSLPFDGIVLMSLFSSVDSFSWF